MLNIVFNIALIVTLVSVAYRFIQFRKSMQKEIEYYENRLDEEENKRRTVEFKMQTDQSYPIPTGSVKDHLKASSSSENYDINYLLSQLENLNHKYNQEMQLRISAENEVVLAMERIDHVERRIEDWNQMQNRSQQATTEILNKIGDDLYHRLTSIATENNKTDNKTENDKENSVMVDDNLQKILQNIQHNIDQIAGYLQNNKYTHHAPNVTSEITDVKGSGKKTIDAEIIIDDFTSNKLNTKSSLK